MGTMMINFYALCLQNIMNLRYQYADSDVLNVAVSGAKIRNLTSEITNLAHQLQKLNDVCTISHQHTQCIVEVFLAENCMENHIFWFIYTTTVLGNHSSLKSVLQLIVIRFHVFSRLV